CRPASSLACLRAPPTPPRPPRSPPFPYTNALPISRLARERPGGAARRLRAFETRRRAGGGGGGWPPCHPPHLLGLLRARGEFRRSEEHTSELQSRENLVCRLLLEKKQRHVHTTYAG